MSHRNVIVTAALLSVPFLLRAHDTGTAGWKKKADGSLELDAAGNPIWLNTAGEALSVDGATISRLNGEAKSHRERAEKLMADIKAFEGIDPVKAKEAFDKLSKIDQKKLIDSGEIDKVRGEIEKGFTAQLNEAKQTNSQLQTTLDNMRLDAAFGNSKFVKDKVRVPVDMFQGTFGKYFKPEDNKLVPYGPDGNKIYSKKRMGEVADVDEALEQLVDIYPAKNDILKGVNGTGSGGNSGGGNRQISRTISRSEFNALTPGDQAKMAAAMREGTAAIVDTH